MANYKLYYERVNGKEIPYWYCIETEKGEIDWDKNVFFTQLKPPIEFSSRDFFNSQKLHIPTRTKHLILSASDPSKIGFNLKEIKKVIDKFYGYPYGEFQQIVIAQPDIDTFLNLLPKYDKRFYCLEKKR